METFEEWFDNNMYSCTYKEMNSKDWEDSPQYVMATLENIWNHQQEKITKLESQIKKAIELLKDAENIVDECSCQYGLGGWSKSYEKFEALNPGLFK
jgi:hypothetical protein